MLSSKLCDGFSDCINNNLHNCTFNKKLVVQFSTHAITELFVFSPPPPSPVLRNTYPPTILAVAGGAMSPRHLPSWELP